MRTVLALTLPLALALPAAAQDEDLIAQGEEVFARECAQCHTVEEEVNELGPHLVGIMGREAGALEDFDYSDAMEESDVVWSPETVEEFIADPQAFIPGNIMPYLGLEDEEERAAVVAYLEQFEAENGMAGE